MGHVPVATLSSSKLHRALYICADLPAAAHSYVIHTRDAEYSPGYHPSSALGLVLLSENTGAVAPT